VGRVAVAVAVVLPRGRRIPLRRPLLGTLFPCRWEGSCVQGDRCSTGTSTTMRTNTKMSELRMFGAYKAEGEADVQGDRLI
jgi:hypothetical protein